MKRTLLKSKIHRAVVTEADLDYEGSLKVDEDLLAAAGMIPFERVDIYNIANGERFSTYLIKGEKGSGLVSVNGAAAHKAKPGDHIIITTYVQLEEDEIEFFMPRVVLVEAKNRVSEVR
ncbi:MAG: aspartate 1-decarboxylase [Candidatus Aminicenantes bacterium]|nr:aspartate 1-decarboxylase [Candidatus Aminicenantes bacterium]